MKENRLNRYNSELKEIVGNCLLNHTIEMQKEFGLITVNEVNLATDLSYLDIFVSSITNQDKLCKELALYAQEIKVSINKNIVLRKMPIIRFRYRDEMEFTTNLLKKINSLELE
ncbi:ribosome-binding factor A [Candidatus Gracilibacteria bacterium]|nr:ribosome-binding factor A [Candidatus Gracilibacteria bacterium]